MNELNIYRQARWACLATALVMGVIAWAVWRVEGPIAVLAFGLAVIALVLAVYFECVIRRWRSKMLMALVLSASLLVGGILGTQTNRGGEAEAHDIYCGPQPSRTANYGMDWLAWYNCWLTDFYHDQWHLMMALAGNFRG